MQMPIGQVYKPPDRRRSVAASSHAVTKPVSPVSSAGVVEENVALSASTANAQTSASPSASVFAAGRLSAGMTSQETPSASVPRAATQPPRTSLPSTTRWAPLVPSVPPPKSVTSSQRAAPPIGTLTRPSAVAKEFPPQASPGRGEENIRETAFVPKAITTHQATQAQPYRAPAGTVASALARFSAPDSTTPRSLPLLRSTSVGGGFSPSRHFAHPVREVASTDNPSAWATGGGHCRYSSSPIQGQTSERRGVVGPSAPLQAVPQPQMDFGNRSWTQAARSTSTAPAARNPQDVMPSVPRAPHEQSSSTLQHDAESNNFAVMPAPVPPPAHYHQFEEHSRSASELTPRERKLSDANTSSSSLTSQTTSISSSDGTLPEEKLTTEAKRPPIKTGIGTVSASKPPNLNSASTSSKACPDTSQGNAGVKRSFSADVSRAPGHAPIPNHATGHSSSSSLTDGVADVPHVLMRKSPSLDIDKLRSVKIFVLYYSMYGHVKLMADCIKEGIESVSGCSAELFRVPETLDESVVRKMRFSVPAEDPVMTYDMLHRLKEADGLVFGIPTRFGMMPAQMKAFFDSTGKLWQKGDLVGKPAALFFSTATQGGGQETTAFTAITQLTHHGMIYVPIGYSFGGVMFDNTEVHGGSPWGAGTLSNGDGSRIPSAYEMSMAAHQGAFFAKVARKLAS